MKWINYNNEFYKKDQHLFSYDLLFSRAICEKINIIDRKIVFWEDHYFFLVACMRIIRMEIPMNYTPDFLKEQVNKTIEKNRIKNGIIDFFCFLDQKTISFLIVPSPLNFCISYLENPHHKIEFYKDFKLSEKSILSQIPFSYTVEKNLANVYANENQLNDVILLNTQNKIAQMLDAYIFIIKNNEILTPKIEEGIKKNVIRKKFIAFLNDFQKEFQIKETQLSPFELQTVDELFFLENLSIRPISHFRKKDYKMQLSKEIFEGWKNYLGQL